MSLVQVFTLFAQITIATMIIPIIVASVYSKKINYPQRVFWYYLIGAFLIAFLARVFVWSTGAHKDFWKPLLTKWNVHDSNFISIVAYLFNFWLLGWYFSSVFDSERTQKRIKFVSAILFVFAIIDNFFIHDWRAYNSDVATASAVYCVLLPLIHLRFVYRTLTEITIQKNPYFWIDLGLLVPNVLGLFLHFTGKMLFDTDKTLYYQISIAKYCFVIVAQLFFAYSFYLARFTKYLPNKW